MLESNKTAEELEKKKKVESEKKKEDQKSKPSEKEMYLEAQVKLLQKQLEQRSQDEEDLLLQKEADELKKEEAALEEEADLKRTLGDAFSPSKTGMKAGDELDQSQLVSIMADAVGSASNAQAKLILSKVDSMMKKTDNRIDGTQKVLMELAASMSVDRARSQFSDFDEHKTEIAKVLSSTKGLSPEDAYLIVKGRQLKDQPDREQIESEKPNEAPAATSSSSEIKDEQDESTQISPKAAFRNAVSAAVDKIHAAREK